MLSDHKFIPKYLSKNILQISFKTAKKKGTIIKSEG